MGSLIKMPPGSGGALPMWGKPRPSTWVLLALWGIAGIEFAGLMNMDISGYKPPETITYENESHNPKAANGSYLAIGPDAVWEEYDMVCKNGSCYQARNTEK